MAGAIDLQIAGFTIILVLNVEIIINLGTLFFILFILPVGFAYFRVKRTQNHPVSASFFYPAFLGIAYFVTSYLGDLITKLSKGDSVLFNQIGYIDPFSIRYNLIFISYIAIWVLVTSLLGFGLFRVIRFRKNRT